MNRSELNTVVDMIAKKKFGTSNDATLSKALGFYFLTKFIDHPIDPIDVWNSDVDASNDRGIDFVYLDDAYDDRIIVHILQVKYSADGSYNIDENEVSKFLLNSSQFPNLVGNINQKLQTRIGEVLRFQQVGDTREVETNKLYINTGTFQVNAISQLELADVDWYDFDRFNSEILLDTHLPDIRIASLGSPLRQGPSSMLLILKVAELMRDPEFANHIKNQTIFHYNVRGLMSNRKNSIAEDIGNTLVNSPEKFFIRNNGITIICRSMEETSTNEFRLVGASIINGQQTMRAIYRFWAKLPSVAQGVVQISAKVVLLDPVTNDDEIKAVSKSTNKQNPIKESDLFANESEQRIIEETASLLDGPMAFSYARKRSIEFPEPQNTITRAEATQLLNILYNRSPSDKIESLYKFNYKSIFAGAFPQHIAIAKAIRVKIESRQNLFDQNIGTAWFNEKFYVRFRKYAVLNYCQYLFSHLLEWRFGYTDRIAKLDLAHRIYEKMRASKNFDIECYFSPDFWKAFQVSTYNTIKTYFDDNTTTMDVLRKEGGLETFEKAYDAYLAMAAASGVCSPEVLA